MRHRIEPLYALRILAPLAVAALAGIAGCGDDTATTEASSSQSATAGPSTSTDATTGTGGVGGSGGSGGAGMITVNGTVIDYVERPIATETVMIGDTIVVTDSQGQFKVPDVVTPYTLRVVDSSVGITDYAGLTSTHPTAQILKYPSTYHQASIVGTLSGATIPLTGTHRSVVQYNALLSGDEEGGQANGGGSGVTFFFGPTFQGTSESGHLTALTYNATPGGQAISYLQYGSSDLTLADGASFSPTLSLSNISSALSHVQIELNGEQALDTIWPFLDRGPASLFLWAPLSAGNPVDIVTPTVPGGTLDVVAFATEGDPPSYTKAFVHGQPLNGNVTVTMPATTVLLSPADGAEVEVVGSNFTWSAPDNQLNILTIYGLYTVVTMADSVTIPDLSSLGISFDAGQQVYWTVVGLGPYSSIDVAAETGTIYRDRQRTGNSYPIGPTSDGFIAIPPDQTLITK